MEAHAHVICTGGGDVLNIGFGLGIIDEVCFRPPMAGQMPALSL